MPSNYIKKKFQKELNISIRLDSTSGVLSQPNIGFEIDDGLRECLRMLWREEVEGSDDSRCQAFVLLRREAIERGYSTCEFKMLDYLMFISKPRKGGYHGVN